MGDLYPLDSKDIEAIGRSRAGRSQPNKIKYWLYAGLLICAGGFFYGIKDNGLYGLGVVVIGAAMVWYSSVLADKRRKYITRQLKAEWRESMDKAEVKK